MLLAEDLSQIDKAVDVCRRAQEIDPTNLAGLCNLAHLILVKVNPNPKPQTHEARRAIPSSISSLSRCTKSALNSPEEA